MTLQQRNGRIDRYGQPQQPQIRYLLTASRSEGMGDTEKILRVLIRKDAQAQQNIGDPSVFLRVFDPAAVETEIEKAVEAGDASGLEAWMEANAAPYLNQSAGDGLFNELFGGREGENSSAGESITVAPAPAVLCREAFSLFPSLWSYVERSLEAVSEQMERRGERLDLMPFPAEQRLKLSPPKDLQRHYKRYTRELQPPRGQRLALSTDPEALQRALEQARRQDSARPELEYLWDLHPLVDWLGDRGLIAFARHQAQYCSSARVWMLAKW
jgi:hypothetical protein